MAVLLLLLRFWTKMSKSSNLKQGIKSIIKRADVAVSYRAVSYRAVSYRGTIKKALRWKTSEKGK